MFLVLNLKFRESEPFTYCYNKDLLNIYDLSETAKSWGYKNKQGNKIVLKDHAVYLEMST